MAPDFLGNSELILSARGNIYHLDLAPEQLATTVIVVGDPGRVKEVSQYFDTITHRAQHREFITHSGTLNGKEISVVSTGIGPDNIDIVLNELDALANIDFTTRRPKENHTKLSIFRLGTCGALQPDIATGSLIVSETGIGMDNLLHFYNYQPTEVEQSLQQAFASHAGLVEKHIFPYVTSASQKLKDLFTDGFIKGITVTCPGFYGPQGRALRLPPAIAGIPEKLSSFRHNGQLITNFEMETSAIYGLGQLLGHDCLSVNTVIANRIAQTFSENAAEDIDLMIQQALTLISR